jgi:uncharacterized protein
MTAVDPSLLAQEWSKQLMAVEENESTLQDKIIAATQRSLPLLEDASSVPFVCRYRTDVISPLTTRQVHFLYSLTAKHVSLASLRNKLLAVVVNDESLRRRIQTSTSKSELEDFYAPFKPSSKGSILERIQKEHPKLVEQVDGLWAGGEVPSIKTLQPRDALVHLLATKIAGDANIVNVVMDELQKHCRVKTSTNDAKYRNYADFSCPLVHLRDHQVLAIRRGVSQKVLKMGYDIDGVKMIGCIRWKLNRTLPWSSSTFFWKRVVEDSVQDAWTRLLRRRGTSRLWSEKCKQAEERAMLVFEQNLRHALLAPPLLEPCHVLSLDPGYKAGIKCAVLDPSGKVLQLETIQYLDKKHDSSVNHLGKLLSFVQDMTKNSDKVVVALGNGHGSHEVRTLMEQVAKQQDISIDIQYVNEAGASVWSVTPDAEQEFPNEPPAGIASISIGRRLLNPLHELVKVPPRSLGLGMYQHDLSEKELDEKLHLASVDAVATVGVNVNTCSLAILEKVPGVTKLAPKIIKARPLRQRTDLLSVSGLGPKTFENCAAFCRVEHGPEPLDATLVHPESYDIAKWLLNKFHWNLLEIPTNIAPKQKWECVWDSELKEASVKFGVSRERVVAVVENLVDSMTRMDPRQGEKRPVSSAGSLDGCGFLASNLMSAAALQQACPVRGIVGEVRNIADFGAFVDFRGHTDGLLHTSNLGPVKLHSLLIGQQIGVDILSVEDDKVSLSLAGLGLTADKRVRGEMTKGAQQRNISSSARQDGNKRPLANKSGSTKSGSVMKRRKTVH